MIVQKMEFTDVFAANCYFYVDEKTKHGFVIDPSAHADRLLEVIKNNKWTIEKILLTHSHFDHIGGVLKLSEELKIGVFGSCAAKEYLLRPELKMHFTDWNVLEKINYLNEGDEIVLSTNKEIKLKVVLTPGHTIDSAVYVDEKENVAFTGDTLFAMSVGRTDIEGSGGSDEVLLESLKKIAQLHENTTIYPGHGEASQIRLIFR